MPERRLRPPLPLPADLQPKGSQQKACLRMKNVNYKFLTRKLRYVIPSHPFILQQTSVL